MPILDHFRHPLSQQRLGNTFHHAWAATIARQLNRQILPDGYFAAPNIRFGPRVEIDVGTFDEPADDQGDGVTATLVRAAPPATATIPAVFPDNVEVLVFVEEGGPQLVAAVELVSPGNKDRPETRRSFWAKMSSYLQQGVALAVVDLVTTRAAHLHNEWIQWSQSAAGLMDDVGRLPLYANGYRPVQRGGQAEIDLWLNGMQLGDPLPNLPLFLNAGSWIELPLEDSYLETCADQRIVVP